MLFPETNCIKLPNKCQIIPIKLPIRFRGCEHDLQRAIKGSPLVAKPTIRDSSLLLLVAEKKGVVFDTTL